MSATLAADVEEVRVDFKGSWIRTSSITGAVRVGNDGLGGVTVKISGVSQSEILTGADGQFAFTGLRAGDYAIEISGFDPEIVAFESTSSEAAVAMGEWKVVDFTGTDLRTSAIMGQVKVEDNPLEGVTVSLVGGGEDRTETTDGVGRYSFDDLQSGAYSVGISGYDTVAYGFDTSSRSLTPNGRVRGDGEGGFQWRHAAEGGNLGPSVRGRHGAWRCDSHAERRGGPKRHDRWPRPVPILGSAGGRVHHFHLGLRRE